MIESKIINACPTRHRNLYRPAKIAATAPDTQVKIYNKSAYYVIKDCADITLKYIAHYAYSKLSNPIQSLKGNITEQDITDFVGRASTDAVTRQLLQVIINDITPSGTIRPREVVTDFTIQDGEDVYGDYDFIDEEDVVDDEAIIKENIVDINNAAEVINKLKSAFL
jgi:hypothetical protein